MSGENVLIFDLTNHYGFHPLKDTNLCGYNVILYESDVLTHYKDNHYEEKNIFKIERYSSFMFKICVKYLKDLLYV